MDSTQNRIELLRQRKTHCVCKYCGSELNIERLVFSSDDNARVELVCSNCQRIDYGVEKEIYQCAKYYFDEIGFNYFHSFNSSPNTAELNIAKIAELIAWGFNHLGYLTNNGFIYPLHVNTIFINESLDISATTLKHLLEEQKK